MVKQEPKKSPKKSPSKAPKESGLDDKARQDDTAGMDDTGKKRKFQVENANESQKRMKWHYDLPRLPKCIQEAWAKVNALPTRGADKNRLKAAMMDRHHRNTLTSGPVFTMFLKDQA